MTATQSLSYIEGFAYDNVSYIYGYAYDNVSHKVMHLTPISHLSGFLHVQAATFCFRFERSYSLASAHGQRGDITSQPKTISYHDLYNK